MVKLTEKQIRATDPAFELERAESARRAAAKCRAAGNEGNARMMDRRAILHEEIAALALSASVRS